MQKTDTKILTRTEIAHKTLAFVDAIGERLTERTTSGDRAAEIYKVFLSINYASMFSKDFLKCTDEVTGINSAMRLSLTQNDEMVKTEIVLKDRHTASAEFSFNQVEDNAAALASTLVDFVVKALWVHKERLQIDSLRLAALLRSLEDMFEVILLVGYHGHAPFKSFDKQGEAA